MFMEALIELLTSLTFLFNFVTDSQALYSLNCVSQDDSVETWNKM